MLHISGFVPAGFILAMVMLSGHARAAAPEDSAPPAVAREAEKIAREIEREAAQTEAAASARNAESGQSAQAAQKEAPAQTAKAAQEAEKEAAEPAAAASPAAQKTAPATGQAADKASPEAENAPAETADAGKAEQDAENDGWEQGVFAGVKNRRLMEGGGTEPKVSLWYPSFGSEAVDADITRFVDGEAAQYHAEVAENAGSEEEKPSSYSMWELSGIFSVERPSKDVASVTFNTYAYSGGAHGNMSIDCLNYNLADGRRLDFDDLFGDPQKALEILSSYSAQKLAKSLGEDADEEMIAEGTAPDPANFKNLTLVPGGLFVEFQPYQVGPWAIGPQRAQFTLEELAPAKPSSTVWTAGQ